MATAIESLITTSDNDEIVYFQNCPIRRAFDSKSQSWLLSVVDIIGVLIQQSDHQTARNYWNVLKNRLKKEGNQSLTICKQFKLKASDGKMRLTDCADVQTLLRLVQSVPSPNAERIKLWLAQVGYERMQETVDPMIAVDRARSDWKKQGYDDDWIQERMTGQNIRSCSTDYWKSHNIKGIEYGVLTNITHQKWADISIKDHKKLKGLKNQSLRDNMVKPELIMTSLSESIALYTAQARNASGFDEIKNCCEIGGNIARNARIELEKQTGIPVVSSQNNMIQCAA